MALVSYSLRNAARLAAALLLAGGLAVPATPSFAASLRGQGFHFNNGGPPRFNIDPGPCGMDGQHMRGHRFGDAACPSPQRNFPRGNGGPHRPGSSAFGLQFDNDGY